MKRSILHWAVALLLFLIPAFLVLKNSYPPLPRSLVFEAEFPVDPIDSIGPLIVSGKYGAGDFLFVEWVNRDEIVFSYHSWGFPGDLRSQPVRLPENRRLHLDIQMPSVSSDSLKPEEKSLKVNCNGVSVLEGSPHFYNATASTLSFGRNLFGQAFCGRNFPGKLFQENGDQFRDGPAAFFSFSERMHAWIGDWWKLLGLAALALVFLWAGKPLLKPLESLGHHPLDRATDLLSRHAFRIQPHAFLIGIVTSLLILSLVGKNISHSGYIENFQRFHPRLNQETYFYPTSSLLKSEAESATRSDQTLVIVGGSSVLHGVGQPGDRLWSQALQKLLGPKYKVMNFAIRAGGPSDNGAIAAEMLRKEGHRVIYVADLAPGYLAEPDGRENYRYIFWDAYYKGLLSPNSAREDYLNNRSLTVDSKRALDETKIATRLNSIFYSLDFWNYQAYANFSTIYTNHMRPFYAPRWQAPDPDRTQEETHYPYGLEDQMKHVRSTLDTFYPAASQGAPEIPEKAWNEFTKKSDLFFPPEVRPETILVTTGFSSFYKKHLSPEEQKKLGAIYSVSQGVYEKAGYHTVNATDALSDEDFIDLGHLSISGGEKLARLVAQKITEVNSKTNPAKR